MVFVTYVVGIAILFNRINLFARKDTTINCPSDLIWICITIIV